MYKLLIVDDEIVIREGLKNIIDWEKFGFTVCGEGVNGRDGLEKIERLQPDLVIADLKMPGIDGLGMIEILRSRQIPCKVIILTGYPEFDYAQKAVELGAEAYLLKPLEEDELIEKIAIVRAQLDDETSRREIFAEVVGAAREKLLENLVLGLSDSEQVRRLNQLYAMQLPWQAYQVLLLDCASSLPLDQPAQQAVRNILDAFIADGNPAYIVVANGCFGLLVRDMTFGAGNPTALRSLVRKIKDKLSSDAVISVGKPVTNLADIVRSYDHAAEFLQKRFILCVDTLILGGSQPAVPARQIVVFTDSDSLADKIHMALETNQTAYINDLLEDIKSKVLAAGLDEHAIKLGYVDICVKLINRLVRSGGELLKLSTEIDQYTSEIFKKPDLQSLHGYVKFLLYHLADEITNKNPSGTMDLIIQYIDSNYSSDLKLSSISEVFGYDNIYLGRLFKKHAGCNFNSYLDHVRIEQAKRLLQQGLKIYEVAEKVGYADKDYFTGKFRKYEKMAPMEYKKLMGDAEGKF